MSRKGLEKEVVRQTFPSGLNREIAFSYHIYTTELFLLAAFEARRSKDPFSSKYITWVKQMIEVIPQLIDVGGNLPRYGDEDGGCAVQLRSFTSSRLEWLYWLGSQVANASIPDLESDMTLLAAIMRLPKEVSKYTTYQETNNSIALVDAGIYVLTRNRGTRREIFSMVDAGPLGFLSIAAHGHADALAFTLSVGGVPVIVDAGTYSYFSGKDERNYFRGTQAHNTITVDKFDQSVSGGAFLWNQKAITRVLNWRNTSESVEIYAEHDGYKRLSGNVIHRRKLSLIGDKFIVNDELQGSGQHKLEWRLHFHPDCEVKLNEGSCRIAWGCDSLSIDLDASLQWKIIHGVKPGGWYSPKFNLKMPTSTLVGCIQTSIPLKLRNTIKIFSP